MENIIFAALLYVLVPALLLWLNRESSRRDRFLAPQLRNNAPTTDLPDRLDSDRIEQTSHKKVLPTIKKHEFKKIKIDYHQLTIRQLKKIARQRKIKRYGTMRKADLIVALIT